MKGSSCPLMLPDIVEPPMWTVGSLILAQLVQNKWPSLVSFLKKGGCFFVLIDQNY